MQLNRRMAYYMKKWALQSKKFHNKRSEAIHKMVAYQTNILKNIYDSWRIKAAGLAFNESVKKKRKAIFRATTVKMNLDEAVDESTINSEKNSKFALL